MGLPNVELFPEPDELELVAGRFWCISELTDEFVSQDEEEFLVDEFKELIEVWFDGGGGAMYKN